MADLTTTSVLSVCATVGSRLSELAVKDGQLIYVRDEQRIALDFDGKRTFYTQIEELATEAARIALLAPVAGLYYFVVDSAALWTYRDGWVQLTTPPREIIFIGAELPELGVANTLYVVTDNNEISVWDDASSSYVVVADKTPENLESDLASVGEQLAVLQNDYNETIIGLSVDGRTVTYIKGDGSVHTFTTQDTDTTYSLGTDETTGLTKLYATTGNAEDGTMTQKAIKTELDKKVSVAVDDTQNILIFTT